jgi:hypothetical protein
MDEPEAQAAHTMPWKRVLGIPPAHRRRLVDAAAVGACALAMFLIVRQTGGVPNAFTNLGYLAIVLGGQFFGVRGGLLAAGLVALLIGPIGAAIGMGVDGPVLWAVRVGTFLAVGTTTGALTDRSRHVAQRWEETARAVIEQRRAGMVALAKGAEAKDKDTGGHVLRVELLSRQLALAAGIDERHADEIGWAGMLHDVGKLHVPDSILLKPGRLTPEEWAIVQKHTIWGEQILGDGAGFELARRVARWHHENIDGTGYPDGLRGEAIPLEARIVRVADSFDAMTHRRPYSSPRELEDALEELVRCRDRQFDPELVELMVRLVQSDAFQPRLESRRFAA